MTSPSLTVPDALSFEQAIAITQSLLEQLSQGQISDQEAAQTVTQLVQTENGARGLFVTYLPDASSVADRPSAAWVAALRSSPEIVTELMLKNLVMSTAMVIHHRRQQNNAMATSSARVQARSALLLHQLALPQSLQRGRQLLESLRTEGGDYQSFLKRWGYDAEQKQAMAATLEQVIGDIAP